MKKIKSKLNKKRSLYDCLEAKVSVGSPGHSDIYCAKGHVFTRLHPAGIPITLLARGAPLKYTICQDCPDFNPHDGPPVPKSERGWWENHISNLECSYLGNRG